MTVCSFRANGVETVIEGVTVIGDISPCAIGAVVAVRTSKTPLIDHLIMRAFVS